MSTPPPTVWPSLRYSDAPAAIDFAVDVLGFERTLVVADDDGTVQHCQLSWPVGGGVMLGSGERPGGPDAHAAVPTDAGGAYVVTASDADVDAVWERALAAGATAVRAPQDQDYGGRGCTLRDPWGVHWSFGSYPGESR